MLITAVLHISEINRDAHGTVRESNSQVLKVQSSICHIHKHPLAHTYNVNTSDVFTAGSRDYTGKADSRN